MTQLSDNNTALIQQGASLMVKALIRQEGGTGNNGTVTQTGEYNDASILQNGTNNVATITQSGVGMAALITAVSLGHGRVIGVDAVPAKLERARELGADEVYTPYEAMDAGIRTPLVVEAAGHPRAFETAFALTAPGGRTVTVGLQAKF